MGTVLTLVFVLLARAKVSEWAAVGLAVVVSLALPRRRAIVGHPALADVANLTDAGGHVRNGAGRC